VSWVWLVLAGWIGFIAGYVLCGILSLSDDSRLWTDNDD
jgi:hypothetical protein